MVTNPRQDDHPRHDTFYYSGIHLVPIVVLARARLDAAHSRYGFLLRSTLIITLPGVDLAIARRLVAERRACGFFKSLDELSATAGLSPALLKSLDEMSAQMQTQKEYKRQ